MTTHNIGVIEKLFAPEIDRIRKRFGDEQAKATAAGIAEAASEKLDALGWPAEATISVDFFEHERKLSAAYKAAQSDVIYKSAPGVPASLELRFAPEDRNAILAALAALKPAAKLSITQADGSVTTLERETGLVTSSRTSPGSSETAPHPSSASDQSFWDSEQHGGAGSPQPNDGAFWDRQDAKRGKPPRTSQATSGQTRGGR